MDGVSGKQVRQLIEARGNVAAALVDGLLADNLEHADQAIEEGDRDEFKKEAYRVHKHRGATVATDKVEVPHTVAAASSSSATPSPAIAEMPRKRAVMPRPHRRRRSRYLLGPRVVA